jgi:hypothetical protein
MNYYDTFIQVASDCPVGEAIVPAGKRDKKSIPRIEYELLVEKPYTFTQEELLFAVHLQRQGISKSELESQRAELWQEFFDKSRACLRASMLPKKYGWGLHFDAEGRIALVARESDEYKKFASGKGVGTLLAAMRNKRA